MYFLANFVLRKHSLTTPVIKNSAYIQFIICFIFISLLLPSISEAQLKDSVKNINLVALPAVFRSPETGWAFGAAGSISFKTTDRRDTLTRTSVIQTVDIFTTKQQNVQTLNATIFFPKEKFIYSNEFSHSYYPDSFWGIGPKTKNADKDSYTFEQFYFFPRLQRKINKNLFAGLLYEYQNVYKVEYNSGGVFDTSKFYGKTKYKVSGIGFSISYDSRNESFWPTKGVLFESLIDRFDKLIGSDYNFVKWTIDLRYFHKLYKNTILAMQFYNYSAFGKVPLRDLGSLGGVGNMRGIYAGRFRDNNMSSFITEYRIPVIWRISVCVFGDIGNVYDKLKDWENSPLKYSYGGGLRFALLKKEKLNIRLDYGYYNHENKGFYFTVGECF